jgi:hypothetical protein
MAYRSLLNSSSPLVVGLAQQLLGEESQGLVIDFTDDFWLADTGHAGSAYILDTTTPANDYDSHPYGKLTYTSPSLKMTRGPDGLLRFGAHNLYLNSASPANQSITVVSGATYAVTITGTVSVTASGAATGTWTAGTQTFTASTTTLTFGSTSGAGTVHVRRTPSDSTYLATTGAARYGLPFEWGTDGLLSSGGLLVEEARTELCLHNSDLTNAAWTKSNLTTAKTATGPDGVANSATTCTATAANATALQAITSGSAARITGAWLRRRTGTGNVDLTQDNGSTWATQAITSSWAFYPIASVTSTNPTVGIRVVTSGDEVDVALFAHQVGAFLGSSIPTLASTVTRAADNITLATSAFPFSDTTRSYFSQVSWQQAPSFNYLFETSIDGGSGGDTMRTTSDTNVQIFNAPTSIFYNTTVSSFTAGLKHATAWGVDNTASSLNGGAVVEDLTGTPDVGRNRINFGSSQSGTFHLNGYLKKVMILPRRMSNAELQTLTAD